MGGAVERFETNECETTGFSEGSSALTSTSGGSSNVKSAWASPTAAVGMGVVGRDDVEAMRKVDVVSGLANGLTLSRFDGVTAGEPTRGLVRRAVGEVEVRRGGVAF